MQKAAINQLINVSLRLHYRGQKLLETHSYIKFTYTVLIYSITRVYSYCVCTVYSCTRILKCSYVTYEYSCVRNICI